MVTQKAGNYPKETKITKQGGLKVNRRAKPHQRSISIKSFAKITSLLKRLMLHYRITFDTVVAFVWVYDNWVEVGVGIGTHSVHDAIGVKGECLRSVQIRMNNLTEKGIVEIVGTGRYGSLLYAPTLDSIKLMQSLDAMLVK